MHTIHPKFYVIEVIFNRADRVGSMHIGTQGMFILANEGANVFPDVNVR